MNIGITCYPTIGGSGVIATELGKLLADRDHQVHFITSSMPFRLGTFYRNIYYHHVEVNQYSVFQYPPYDLTLASKMSQVIQQAELDILHVHYAIPHAISAYLAKQMANRDIKIVTTLHGTDISVLGHDENLANLIRFGIEESDGVTAVSQSLIDETKALLDIKKPIKRIYNFIDQRVFTYKDSKELRDEIVPSHQKVLLHISNFRKVKRSIDVVKVFKLVQKVLPTKLIFIGEGPELPQVKKLIEEYGLEEEVIFLGKMDEVAEIISLADCILLPSEKESFGLVALEGMACGVPIVCTSAGGIEEVVLHGETGYLAPIGDIEQMAYYVLKLLQNEILWEHFSRNSLERVKTHFTASHIVDQYEQLYRSILG